MRSLEKAASICGGALNAQEKNRFYSGISIDTRTLCPGDLFFALRGPRFDGHAFIPQAFQKGASAAVVSRPGPHPGPVIAVGDTLHALHRLARWYRSQFSHPVVAVTGSAGKTTTKECIAAVLSQVFDVRVGFGNWNNHIGVPLNLFRLKPEDQCFVLELGANHVGEIRLLAEMAEPTVGVLTGVEPAHLEGFGSLEHVYRAKLELADFLEERNGTLIVNGDNPRLVRRAKARKCPVITYGGGRHCDFYLSRLAVSDGFICFEVNGTLEFRLEGYGAFNAMNALAALAVAGFFKLDLKALSSSWHVLPSVESRFQVFQLEPLNLQIVDDSYNANPHSFAQALESFQALADGRRKIVVAGDMLELGAKAVFFHEQLGRSMAEAGVDVLIGVGSLSQMTVKSFLAQRKQAKGMHATNREAAMEALKSVVKRNDSILIKGSHSMGLGNFRSSFESLMAGELAHAAF